MDMSSSISQATTSGETACKDPDGGGGQMKAGAEVITDPDQEQVQTTNEATQKGK